MKPTLQAICHKRKVIGWEVVPEVPPTDPVQLKNWQHLRERAQQLNNMLRLPPEAQVAIEVVGGEQAMELYTAQGDFELSATI